MKKRWIFPRYSLKQIDAAGRDLLLSKSNKPVQSFLTISNWRAAHAFPLNTLQLYLRKNSYSIDKTAVVVQRLKKIESILLKLRRFNKMELSRMQDIGGCRSILATVKMVRDVVDSFTNSRMRHKLVNHKDYIATPQKSGYRGIHLVYRYHSDRNELFNGFQVELQIRTRLQHMWATSVETIGVFTNQSLKSSMGSIEWLRLMALISTEFAREENCPIVPETNDSKNESISEIRALVNKLDAFTKLDAYRVAVLELNKRRNKDFKFYLLNIDRVNRMMNFQGFGRDELEKAAKEYLNREKENMGTQRDVVLVSSDTLESVQYAYPNYFMDTTEFSKKLKEIVQKN